MKMVLSAHLLSLRNMPDLRPRLGFLFMLVAKISLSLTLLLVPYFISWLTWWITILAKLMILIAVNYRNWRETRLLTRSCSIIAQGCEYFILISFLNHSSFQLMERCDLLVGFNVFLEGTRWFRWDHLFLVTWKQVVPPEWRGSYQKYSPVCLEYWKSKGKITWNGDEDQKKASKIGRSETAGGTTCFWWQGNRWSHRSDVGPIRNTHQCVLILKIEGENDLKRWWRPKKSK